MILSRLKGRLKRFNVSVSEVEHQDTWQRTALAVVCVGASHETVDALLRSSTAAIEHEFVGEILDIHMEYLT